MRILLCHRPGGAFGFITDGWINALRSKNHQVERWDGKEATWRDFSPELYIGCSGHRQPIPARRGTQLAIHVNPYGPVHIAGINESQDNINWTLQQKPNVVFGYGTEEDRILWSYWRDKHGIPWVPMPTAGDKCIYRPLCTEEQKDLDVVYLGGRWGYKATNIDAFLFPVLNSRLTCKVHGWGDWPTKYNVTALGEDQVTTFLSRGRVGPCIAEPHTHTHGFDVPERMFKVALCGTLIVHDAVPNLKRLVPSAVVAQNPVHFADMCRHYSSPNNAAERIALVQQQRAEVLAAHTYHHRMATLLAACGYPTEAQTMVHDE